MAEQNEEGKKTIVSFIVGLLIGGLLVWSFSGTGNDVATPEDTEDTTAEEVTNDTDNTESTTDSEETNETPQTDTTVPPVATLPTGDGAVNIADTSAGNRIPMESATFPVAEGWVGVRDYNNGQLGPILGVVRFSEEQGLVPTEIILQRATVRGNEYAVVFYTEDGDRDFNLATDVQIDGVVTTFTAS